MTMKNILSRNTLLSLKSVKKSLQMSILAIAAVSVIACGQESKPNDDKQSSSANSSANNTTVNVTANVQNNNTTNTTPVRKQPKNDTGINPLPTPPTITAPNIPRGIIYSGNITAPNIPRGVIYAGNTNTYPVPPLQCKKGYVPVDIRTSIGQPDSPPQNIVCKRIIMSNATPNTGPQQHNTPTPMPFVVPPVILGYKAPALIDNSNVVVPVLQCKKGYIAVDDRESIGQPDSPPQNIVCKRIITVDAFWPDVVAIHVDGMPIDTREYIGIDENQQFNNDNTQTQSGVIVPVNGQCPENYIAIDDRESIGQPDSPQQNIVCKRIIISSVPTDDVVAIHVDGMPIDTREHIGNESQQQPNDGNTQVQSGVVLPSDVIVPVNGQCPTGFMAIDDRESIGQPDSPQQNIVCKRITTVDTFAPDVVATYVEIPTPSQNVDDGFGKIQANDNNSSNVSEQKHFNSIKLPLDGVDKGFVCSALIRPAGVSEIKNMNELDAKLANNESVRVPVQFETTTNKFTVTFTNLTSNGNYSVDSNNIKFDNLDIACLDENAGLIHQTNKTDNITVMNFDGSEANAELGTVKLDYTVNVENFPPKSSEQKHFNSIKIPLDGVDKDSACSALIRPANVGAIENMNKLDTNLANNISVIVPVQFETATNKFTVTFTNITSYGNYSVDSNNIKFDNLDIACLNENTGLIHQISQNDNITVMNFDGSEANAELGTVKLDYAVHVENFR